MNKYIVVTFESVNFAMQTESVLKNKEIKHQIIPTPREITLSCGLSVKTDYDNLDNIKFLIEEGFIKNKKLFAFEITEEGKKVKEIL